jgi:hypothetical protein
MHHHSCRLVHDQEGIVLVDDADRYVLARNRPLLHLRDLDANDFPPFRTITRFFTPTVDQNVPLSDQGRSLRPGELGPLGNKQIEADIAVRLDGKLSRVAQN